MARTNLKAKAVQEFTHEGGKAFSHMTKEQELKRSVLSCMLYEKEFYESGVSVAQRIETLIPEVAPEVVAKIVSEARNKMHLRHVPLLITRIMAKLPEHKKYVAKLLGDIIQRADELTEFLALYMADGKQPISAQVKRGLAAAYNKFNEYQLAKYNRDNKFKLKDIMFLVHPKPFITGASHEGCEIVPAINKPKYKRGEVLRHKTGKGGVFQRIITDTLATPDTWEVGLSASKSSEGKKSVFEKLITEKKLGAMALLRNLRKMQEVGVSETMIKDALVNVPMDKVLPFRFIAAARYAVNLEPYIEAAMFKCLQAKDMKLSGKTVLLVDVSGSMDSPISAKSEMMRMDAACGLAVLMREVCEDVRIFSFSNDCKEIPNRRGFALRDAIVRSQGHSGTYLGRALEMVNAVMGNKYDRILVFTDEQSADKPANPICEHAYIINVASYKNGIGYGAWNQIDGFSEAIIDYVIEFEKTE